MTPRDYVIEQISHHVTRPVPYTLHMSETITQGMNAHYGSEGWLSRVTKYLDVIPIVTYHAKPVDIDENHFRDAYGGVWRKDRNVNHQISTPLSEPSLSEVSLPAPEQLISREVLASAAEQCERSKDRFRLGMLGPGVWEFFWHLRGYENALMDVAAEPAFAQGLCELMTEQTIAYINLVSDLPLDGIFLGDDWGGQNGVLLGPDLWRRYVKPSWEKVIEAAHAIDLPVFNHCCGSVAAIMPDVIEMGLDCLESVQPEAAGNDPYLFKKEYGKDITFWGGLGSQSIIPFGKPEDLTNEIQKLVREMGRGGGYILAPAKWLMPDTPLENAVAIYEAFVDQE